MKKVIGLALATVFTASGLAADFQAPKDGLKAMDAKKITSNSREIVYDNIGDTHGHEFPSWEFDVDEVVIESNFYDYMPGSYNSLPVRVDHNGRVYIAFHRKPTNETGELRRAYYAQIENGELSANDNITSAPGNQGYIGIDLDPVSGDPFYAWHENMDDDETYEVGLAWEAYAAYPSLVKTPFPVIDNSEIAGVYTPFDDDEYIWPYLYISNSPAGDGMRRIHVIANNYVSHHGEGSASESALIAYVDFGDEEVGDLAGNPFETLEWNYETVPVLDTWNAAEGDVWTRPMKSPIVSEDGEVAFVGYVIGDNYANGDANLFYIHTDDIANPAWEDSYTVGFQPCEYPANSIGGGSMPIEQESIGFAMANTGHFNPIYSTDGKIRFIGNQAPSGIDETDPESEVYFPDFQYVKEFVVDPATGSYEIVDLHPQGVDIHDGNPALPWDLDEDGEYDNTVEDAEGVIWPVIPDNFPIEYWDTGNSLPFHTNKYNMTAAKEQPWLFAIWMDATKGRLLHDGTDEEYADYANVPEIFICASSDNGTTWTKPLVLNSMNTPELEGEIPSFIYPGDKIVVDGDFGYVDLFYLDDNSWGSSTQSAGAADGGTQKYARLKINYGELMPVGNEDTEQVVVNEISTQNYPNPFNPTTKINFSIKNDSNVGVKIYNVKGELVKTIDAGFQQSGTHHVMWNGVDNDNNDVASGVYFYKVTAGNETAMNKMILMK